MDAVSSHAAAAAAAARTAVDAWHTHAQTLTWKADLAMAAAAAAAAVACAVACRPGTAGPSRGGSAIALDKYGNPLPPDDDPSGGGEIDPELWANAVTTALAFRGFRQGVAASRKEGASQRPSIMLFGDSITQFSFNPELCGWGAAMAHWYARQANVLNRGFSGYNTRQGLVLLRKLLPLPDVEASDQPRLLTIKFGANDAADADLNRRQHVPLAEYETNLAAMVQHARATCPGILILLITPPSVDEGAYAAHNLKLKRRKKSDPLDRTVRTHTHSHSHIHMHIHSTAQHSTAQHSTVQYSTGRLVVRSASLCGAVLQKPCSSESSPIRFILGH